MTDENMKDNDGIDNKPEGKSNIKRREFIIKSLSILGITSIGGSLAEGGQRGKEDVVAKLMRLKHGKAQNGNKQKYHSGILVPFVGSIPC